MKKTITIDNVRIAWTDDLTPRRQHCQAIATVSYPCERSGDRRLEHFASAGLGGIEDASPSYRREIELDELSELRDHLEAFGIQTGNFAARFAPEIQR